MSKERRFRFLRWGTLAGFALLLSAVGVAQESVGGTAPASTDSLTEAVREFLSEAMPRLSPKVFRTYSATHAFKQELDKSEVIPEDSDAEKKMSAVAQLLNHQKAVPKKWEETYQKRLAMLRSLKGKEGKGAAKRRGSLKLRLAQMKLNKKWNLSTSLKNYIDPRVSVAFCQRVGYDWKLYYPKALVTKFAWAEQKQLTEAPVIAKI
jgi:DNA topoisomerase-1